MLSVNPFEQCRSLRSLIATCAFAAAFSAPFVASALERETSFSVTYCRAWTTTSPRNDGCFVDTDIMLTSNSVVEVELEVTDTAATVYLFSAGPSYQLSSTGTQWQFNYGGTAAANTAKGGEVVKDRRYVVKTSPQGIYADGELVASRSPLNFTPSNPLTLFSQATSQWNRGHLRFFWMKIYEPDSNGVLQLAHELKPCMIVGGRMGVYDEIGGGVWANGSDNWRALGGPLVVPAPNGVGNVVALTNALAAVKRLNSYAKECRVLLEPGTYNLAGHKYKSGTHLNFASGGASGLYLAGLGDGPGDTILLGGGETDGCRVIQINSLTISNLTVTGGYLSAADNGGGVYGASGGSGAVVDCIVSNNYAKGSNGAGGGGAWGVKAMRRCLVADNRSGQRGGGLRDVSLAEDCVITNNFAAQWGGGVAGGRTVRCLIAGNVTQYYGGGQANGYATDCVFDGNVAFRGGINAGFGGGLYSAVATNCVFVRNSDNANAGCAGATASQSTLVGCVISNSVARRMLFDRCRLIRCHVTDVGASDASASTPFHVFNRYSGSVVYTNVNCLVENVTMSNTAQRVAAVSVFVNCTIRNAKGNTKYGPLNSDCTAVNTIISGCEPYDVTATTAPILANCLYQTSSGTFAEGRLVDCVQGNPRYDLESDVPGAIRRSSPAYNTGRGDAWILNLVGETDFAGNPRVKFDRIDIGAIERQSDLLPGLRLSVQ